LHDAVVVGVGLARFDFGFERGVGNSEACAECAPDALDDGLGVGDGRFAVEDDMSG
jgi:hypothetical protein